LGVRDVPRSGKLRRPLAITLAMTTLVAGLGALGSLPQDGSGRAFPPACPPGLALVVGREAAASIPAPASFLWPSGRDGRDTRTGPTRLDLGGQPGVTAAAGQWAGAASVAAGPSAVGSAYQPSDNVLRDLAALTDLQPGTLRLLATSLGDWRPIAREAPLYRLLAERAATLKGEGHLIISAIESGADPFELLSLVECLEAEGLPVAELPAILARRASGAGWAAILDPIRTKYGKAEPDPLTKNEIRDYLSRGLAPEDVVEAIGLGRVAGQPSRSLLDERLAGRTWVELAAAYDPEGRWAAKKVAAVDSEAKRLLTLGYGLAEIRLAQVYARAMGLEAEAVLRQTTGGLPVTQVAANRAAEMEAAQERSLLDKLKATYGASQATLERWRGLGLGAHEVENVLRLARVRGLNAETVVGLRLGGASWEDILERLAPAAGGGSGR